MQPNPLSNVVGHSSSITAHVSSSSQSSLWRGREIHKSKSDFPVTFEATLGAILTLVGALIFSSLTFARMLIGGSLMAVGVYAGYDAYQDIQSPNELEEALKYLTHQKNLDNLPEISWKTEQEKSGPLPRLSFWGASSMSQTVMALKEKGKTIAVAIKYFDPYGYRNEPKNMIAVFSFKGKFEESTFQGRTDKNKIFKVQGFITAREGRLLESLLQSKP